MNTKKWLSDKDYTFIYSSVPRFCVDILIINEEYKVLLIKRKTESYKGKWHLPGGRIRFKESIEKGIHRVVKAELGIKIKVGKMIGYMEFLREAQNKSPRHSISLVFLATPEENINKGDKLTGKFFKQLPKSTLSVHKKFIENYLKEILG